MMKKTVSCFLVVIMSFTIMSVLWPQEAEAKNVWTDIAGIFTPKSTSKKSKEPADASDYSDIYKGSVYYQRLKQVVLTGDYRRDIIAIAESQLGYHEGNAANEIDGSFDGDKNYTEYGRWFGTNGRAWCSEFASWCARQAGVPKSILGNSSSANVQKFKAPYYAWSETVFVGGKYQPRAGDLVLYAWNGTSHTDKNLSHTAIVCSAEATGDTVTFITIDGNSGGKVSKKTVVVNRQDGSLKKGHMVYFVAPKY